MEIDEEELMSSIQDDETPIGTGKTKFNPKSLANLKPWNADTARKMQLKAAEARSRNHQMAKEFKMTAKSFKLALDELPDVSALDVMRMAMHMAIQNNKMDDAARYAQGIAEYERPKLQRIDQTTTQRVTDMTAEELDEIIRNEGLV